MTISPLRALAVLSLPWASLKAASHASLLWWISWSCSSDYEWRRKTFLEWEQPNCVHTLFLEIITFQTNCSSIQRELFCRALYCLQSIQQSILVVPASAALMLNFRHQYLLCLPPSPPLCWNVWAMPCLERCRWYLNNGRWTGKWCLDGLERFLCLIYPSIWSCSRGGTRRELRQ